MTTARVACIIPAFNAAASLGAVIAGVRAALPDAVTIVVDDGSTDTTHAVAQRIADVTERFSVNRGKGAALRAGFRIALEHGAGAVVTVDADGQHDPRYAPALLDALSDAELVIGARDARSAVMPVGRRITNRLSAAAVARCIGQPVADAQSGFRAARADVVADIAPRGDRYEFETEFLVLAARHGYRVAFVPVPTMYPGTVPSRFRPVRDSARIVSTLWQLGVGAQR